MNTSKQQINCKKKKKIPIEKVVRKLVKQYFSTIDTPDHHSHLHHELIYRVERELIVSVMKATDNNQSQAARVLGISRTTLRKKLVEFNLV